MPHPYMLLLHSKPANDVALSPAELMELIGRYKAWSAQMAQQGRLSGGEKLTDDGGRVIRLQGSQVIVSDGPYAEAQDVVGGYFLINADDDAQAVALAQTCPHLHGTQWIEVRRIDPMTGG